MEKTNDNSEEISPNSVGFWQKTFWDPDVSWHLPIMRAVPAAKETPQHINFMRC